MNETVSSGDIEREFGVSFLLSGDLLQMKVKSLLRVLSFLAGLVFL